MKINRQKLRLIIKEELRKVINEQDEKLLHGIYMETRCKPGPSGNKKCKQTAAKILQRAPGLAKMQLRGGTAWSVENASCEGSEDPMAGAYCRMGMSVNISEKLPQLALAQIKKALGASVDKATMQKIMAKALEELKSAQNTFKMPFKTAREAIKWGREYGFKALQSQEF